MVTRHIPGLLWAAFLLYYSYVKYVAGSSTWNTQYAVQVAIIVVMTAVVPYYLSRFVVGRWEGIRQLVGSLVLPVLLCGIGYAIFYYTQVKPSFPDVTLAQVLPRSLLPGLVIAVLLLMSRFLPDKT